MARFDDLLADNENGVQEMIDGLKQAAGHTDRLMQDSAGLIQNFDQRLADLYLQLLMTSRNLKTASDNLNVLIKRVSDQPSQLFFGEPTPPRKIENQIPDQ